MMKALLSLNCAIEPNRGVAYCRARDDSTRTAQMRSTPQKRTHQAPARSTRLPIVCSKPAEQHGPGPRLKVAAAAAMQAGTAQPLRHSPEEQASCIESDADVSGSANSCMIPKISVDNDEHPDLSTIQISTRDFPGQFRTTAWVLNGLGLEVHNAELAQADDGVAQNKFWLADIKGHKLTQCQLDLVAERLEDLMGYCNPDDDVMRNAKRFCHGRVTIDNSIDPKLSLITIFAPSQREQRLPHNALLDIASCINGFGVHISQAVIQACTDCGTPISEGPGICRAEPHSARLYKVWGTDRAGCQLDQTRAIALIYTMSLLFGDSSTTGSISVPRCELY